jgi:polysaccharide export outer membrane protein
MKEARFVLIGLVALLATCMPAGFGQQPSITSSSPAVGSTVAAGDPQLEERNPRYKIQCQDVLLLSFPLSPELNQTVTVQPDGYISLQAGGSVFIKNLTVPEVIAVVKAKYSGTLHNPMIDITLEDFQKPFFVASGQVTKPGQYDLRSDITVAEAIAVAGGLAPTAKTQVFLFHRTSNEWFKVRQLNLKDILNGKKANEDAMIQPGDMIFVPEKFITNFRKYVPYNFNLATYLSPAGSF